MKKEGNETVSNCHQLNLEAADDNMRLLEIEKLANYQFISIFAPEKEKI